MKTVTVEEAIILIRNYLENAVDQPFFVSVDGTEEYREIYNNCPMTDVVRVSDQCELDDVWPSVDKLRAAVANVRDRATALGVGDLVALGGSKRAITAIKGLYLKPGGKLVVLCRGVRALLDQESEDDPKFNSRRYCRVDSTLSYVVTRVEPGQSFDSIANDKPKYAGFKELLRALEDGAGDRLYVSSALPITVNTEIATAYAALVETRPEFGKYPEEALDAEQWRELAIDPSLEGYNDLHWRNYLKRYGVAQSNPYFALVYKNARNYQAYRRRLFNALLDVDVNAPEFNALYNARKTILEDLPKKELEREIHRYLGETNSKEKKRFRYLTDVTRGERNAVVGAIADLQEIPQELANVYPALYQYASRYEFVDSQAGEDVTEYFDEYKRCKLFNRVSAALLDRVNANALANPRPYQTFASREEIVGARKSAQCKLYWLDALGVEYLAFICKKARELKLKLDVAVGYASLPSTTEWNDAFYRNWQGDKFGKNGRLDDLLHEVENVNYNDAPYYIVDALEIIESALEEIRAELDEGKARRVMLVSDHGATRAPAIIDPKRQRRLETEEANGCSGGRCAPVDANAKKPDVAAEENGFWSLANYDRFKGGSLQGREAHGGATLEEVLVPIIVFSLLENAVELTLLTNDDAIVKDRDKPILIQVQTSQPVSSLELRFNRKKFVGKKQSPRRFEFDLSGLNAATYEFEGYEGETPLDTVKVTIKPRGGGMNHDDFDFFGAN